MILVGRKIFLDGLVFKSNTHLLILTRGRKTINAGFSPNSRRPINEIVSRRCYSSPGGKGGGQFRYEFLNSIERFADRLYSRWLYFRYDGALGPQPESFTAKQKRKTNILSFCILFVFLLVCLIGQNFDPKNSKPLYVGIKIWPDNIEEYRELLDAKNGKVSSYKSSSLPTPTTPSSSPSTTVTTNSP